MNDITKQDIQESMEWYRKQMESHGFDVSQPIQDMNVFFQAQEASMDTLDNEISDIADEYGEDSLEVEAAEELRDDVEAGFQEVGEETNEKLKKVQKDFTDDERADLFDKMEKLMQQNEELTKKVDFLQHKGKYRLQAAMDIVSKAASQAKDFASKTFDNVKQFCEDRKQDIFYAVDKARVNQATILKEFYTATRDFSRDNQQFCEDWYKRTNDMAYASALAKAAKGNVLNKALRFLKDTPVYRKLIPKEVDLNTVTGDKTAWGAAARLFKKEADFHEAQAQKQNAKIAALDEKIADIANKWQDKAKEPTQKSFEENLHRFEKEAEMENQNINPQRTQSQER